MDADSLYCRSLVASHDYDRFVLAAAAPAAVRPALLALYAFNYEISKALAVTTDPRAALLRLAWWREAIEKDSGDTEILREIKTHRLDKTILENLIDARWQEAEKPTFASLDDTAAYATSCNAPLVSCSAMLAGETLSDNDTKAIACAYGMCGQIRSIVSMATQNRCFIPASLMYEIGIMPEQIHLLAPSKKLNDAVAMLAARAWHELEKATVSGPVLRRHKALTAFYLKRIGSVGFDPFNPRVYLPVPFLGFRVIFYDQ